MSPGDPRLSRLFLAALIVALLAAPGCRRPQPTSTPGQEEEGDVDSLRALPYLNYSPRKAGDEHGVVVWDRERSQPGLTLVSHRKLCRADLVDEAGEVELTWELENCHRWENAEILANGDLFAPVIDRAPPKEGKRRPRAGQRTLVRMDLRGNVLWRKPLPVHHDMDLTPDGRIVTLLLSSRKLPPNSPYKRIRDDSVALVSLEGEILEQVSLWDLFTADPERFPLQEVEAKRGHIDLFHANSVQWMEHEHLESRDAIYDRGNVLVSIRHQDVVAIINWEAQELVWMWGRGEISGPHDATVLENGNLLLFDNGLKRGWTRVIELDPLTETIVWEYKAPDPPDFFSISKGANQRLDNGNTLITNSDNGQIFEVTREGDIVWEYLNPNLNPEGHRYAFVRAKRYERDFLRSMR